MFTLEKISIEDGKDSMVPVGHSASSKEVVMFHYTHSNRKNIISVNEVEVGWQLLIGRGIFRNTFNTSPIKEILIRAKDYVTFRTQTSIYKLTKTEG